jgi:hypothetical protein
VTPSNCRFYLGIRVSLIVLYLIIIIIINKQINISLLFLIEDIQKTLILCSNSKYTLALGCMVRERKKIKWNMAARDDNELRWCLFFVNLKWFYCNELQQLLVQTRPLLAALLWTQGSSMTKQRTLLVSIIILSFSEFMFEKMNSFLWNIPCISDVGFTIEFYIPVSNLQTWSFNSVLYIYIYIWSKRERRGRGMLVITSLLPLFCLSLHGFCAFLAVYK